MTVSTTHVSNSFTGNASQTVFTFTFHCLSTSHLQVKLAGVVQNSGFTPAINRVQSTSAGGTITFSVAPGNGVAVLIERVTPKTQALGFSREARLNTASVETALDKLTLIAQEIAAS